MKKLRVVVGMVLAFSFMALGLSGYSTKAMAETLVGNWQELEYGHQAVLERQEERTREMQLQQYQQQQYMQQQQLMNQKNLYNQSHQSQKYLTLGATLEGSRE
jgi:hypothetical protein